MKKMRVTTCIRRCAPLLFLLAARLRPPAPSRSPGPSPTSTTSPRAALRPVPSRSRTPEKTPQEVKVYQTDYLFYADGSTYYGDPGTMPRSNTRWISFTPKQFTVPAGEEVTVRYTIQVPNDARLAGPYWSILMVEPVEARLARVRAPRPRRTG